MPAKRVAVDYSRCRPQDCEKGICAAALACPHKILRQEAPYEFPLVSPSTCPDCARCAEACKQKAIRSI